MWSVTFAGGQQPSALGNITVYIVSAAQLVFSIILPGSAVSVPPTVVSTWISPANPTVGQGFTVNATLAGSYTSNSVYLNVGSVQSTSVVKMTQNGQGVWGFVVKAGNTTNSGTFYGFVNASNAYGQTTTGAIVITISSTGSSNGPLSVGVVLVPSPPNAGVTESVQAVVTYTGSLSGLGLTVSFAGTSNPSGYTFTGVGPSGVTISGPSSVTVVSLSTWTIPSPNSLYSYNITATATVGALTPVTGSTLVQAGLGHGRTDERANRDIGNRHGFGVFYGLRLDRHSFPRRGGGDACLVQFGHALGARHHTRGRRRIRLHVRCPQRSSGRGNLAFGRRYALAAERHRDVHSDLMDHFPTLGHERRSGH